MRKMFSEKQIETMIDGKVVEKELVSYDGENLKDADGNTIEVGGGGSIVNTDLFNYSVGDKVLVFISGSNDNDQYDVVNILGNIISKSFDEDTGNGSIVIGGGITYHMINDTIEVTTNIQIEQNNKTITFNMGIPSYNEFLVSSTLTDMVSLKF